MENDPLGEELLHLQDRLNDLSAALQFLHYVSQQALNALPDENLSAAEKHGHYTLGQWVIDDMQCLQAKLDALRAQRHKALVQPPR